MVQFPSIRRALGHTLEQELSGTGRRLTTIDGEVIESSTDRSKQIEHPDAGRSQSGRALSPLGASIGRIGGSEANPSSRPSNVSSSQPVAQHPKETTHSQRQKTQSLNALNNEALEKEFVPSRQRDEFLRLTRQAKARSGTIARRARRHRSRAAPPKVPCGRQR